MEQNKPWHTLTRDAAYELLSSSPDGLTNAEASKRLLETGPNEIKAAKRISAWEILLEQFKNVLVLILLGAAAISLFLDHGVEAIVIAVIVLFAVFLGFIQEYRAERAIEAFGGWLLQRLHYCEMGLKEKSQRATLSLAM